MRTRQKIASGQGRTELFDEEFLRLLEQLHLLAKRLGARGGAGRRRSRRLGDGLEFADHRDYAAGDDLRFIDWPYYARMEKLLLRMFHEHSEADVWILLDTSGSMAPTEASRSPEVQKFDYARRTAAALAYVAMGSFERVVCQPFAQELAAPFRTGRNRGQILEVLDFLRGLACSGVTRLGRCVDELVRRHGPSGTVLLVTDLLDCGPELSDALAHLRQHGDVALVHVFSPEDASPSLHGAITLQQAETGAEMNVHVGEELLAGYRKSWEAFRSGCERTAVSRGAGYVAAPTSAPFEKLVLQTLRQAGVLE